jgi:hypothetical protein
VVGEGRGAEGGLAEGEQFAHAHVTDFADIVVKVVEALEEGRREGGRGGRRGRGGGRGRGEQDVVGFEVAVDDAE